MTNPAHPFSDTQSLPTTLPLDWDQAVHLARRLGLSSDGVANNPGKWQSLLLTGIHSVLDRLDALERVDPQHG